MRMTQRLAGKQPRLRRALNDHAVATLNLTAPHAIVQQQTRRDDHGETYTIGLLLEQDGVSIEVTLSRPDETITELGDALRWLHSEKQGPPPHIELAAQSRASSPPRVACRLRGWSWRTGRGS